MLNNLAYLFGLSTADTPQEGSDSGATSPPGDDATLSTPADNVGAEPGEATPSIDVLTATPTEVPSDWVFVDVDELCDALHKYNADQSKADCCTCNVSDCDSNQSPHASGLSTPNISSRGSMSPVSCHLYVRTKYGRCREAFFLTPPPCFTASNGSVPAMTELENLLIERPGSMSVYNMLPGCSDIRTAKSKKKSSASDMVPRAKCQSPPKRPHPFDDQSILLAKVAQVEDAQRSQQKHSTKSYSKKGLARMNKSLMCDRRTSPRSRISNPSGQKNGRQSQRMH